MTMLVLMNFRSKPLELCFILPPSPLPRDITNPYEHTEHKNTRSNYAYEVVFEGSAAAAFFGETSKTNAANTVLELSTT